MLDHIGIDCNNFDLLRYTNITRFKTYIHDTLITYIAITLYDDENNIISIQSHWSLSLEFDEIKFRDNKIPNRNQ